MTGVPLSAQVGGRSGLLPRCRAQCAESSALCGANLPSVRGDDEAHELREARAAVIARDASGRPTDHSSLVVFGDSLSTVVLIVNSHLRFSTVYNGCASVQAFAVRYSPF